MATLYEDIYNGLLEVVTTLDDLPPIVVEENTDHKTKKFTEESMKVSLLPATPLPMTLGRLSIQEYNGIFQVTFRVPSRTGTAQLYQYADFLASLMRPYLIFTPGDLDITVTNFAVGSILVDSDWTTLPTSITWRVIA